MKRITVAALIFTLLFSACSKQGQSSTKETSSSTPPSIETSDNGGAKDSSSKTTSSPSVEELVQEFEKSKGKEFHYPKLNENILGERAKKFNKEIQLIYEESIKSGIHDEEGGEIAEHIRYYPYIDQERQLFSIAAHYIEPRGYLCYETAVFDLADPTREVSFTEILKSFDWEAGALRKRIEIYFENIYAMDSHTVSLHGDYDSDVEFQDFDQFMKDRMAKYDEEVREGMPYTVDEEGLRIYFTTAFPSFMESHTERYLVRENIVDDLFSNETFGSLMAIVNRVTEAEREKLNIVEEIHPEGRVDGVSEKIFVALEDDVDFYVRTLRFDEATNSTVPNEAVYRKVLKKGEAVSVHALVSEGIPTVQAVAEFRPKDPEFEEDASYSFFYDFFYNGLYGEVKIEFLQGELGNG